MAPGNGEIRRNRYFFALARVEQRAIVADPEPYTSTSGPAPGSPPDLAQQAKFPRRDVRIWFIFCHSLSIRQAGATRLRQIDSNSSRV
jgi:hypothetical protein